jgi:isoamylase
VNFITAHDGFTLADLVSYNDKHNEANGEESRDGHNDNRSFNHGVEGPTEDAGILAERRRQKRNLLASLFMSHGTAMLLAGDELGRTQKGNNNAYCQDNEISWVNWQTVGEEERALTDFVRRLIKIRADRPILRRSSYRDGMCVEWLNSGGGNQTEEHWEDAAAACIGLHLRGAAQVPDEENGKARADELIIVFNAHDGPVDFKLPKREEGWQVVLDTNEPDAVAGERIDSGSEEGATRQIAARSLVLLE